jgi:hypothetical protein
MFLDEPTSGLDAKMAGGKERGTLPDREGQLVGG